MKFLSLLILLSTSVHSRELVTEECLDYDKAHNIEWSLCKAILPSGKSFCFMWKKYKSYDPTAITVDCKIYNKEVIYRKRQKK